jgi:hypothetical protein
MRRIWRMPEQRQLNLGSLESLGDAGAKMMMDAVDRC